MLIVLDLSTKQVLDPKYINFIDMVRNGFNLKHL